MDPIMNEESKAALQAEPGMEPAAKPETVEKTEPREEPRVDPNAEVRTAPRAENPRISAPNASASSRWWVTKIGRASCRERV